MELNFALKRKKSMVFMAKIDVKSAAFLYTPRHKGLLIRIHKPVTF